jgi:DNA (cytosine-5)-methyltransferase 1
MIAAPQITGLKPWALYNEIDIFAAEWLRNLIKAGQIADGIVDERSVADIDPDELSGFTQFHTFAGIGLWSLSLRNAGITDDMNVWTGSCPCQPFSSAGQQKGLDDERHLWPAWFKHIDAQRPALIFGEQVASADAIGKANRKPDAEPEQKKGWAWIDFVQDDLENAHYAVGAEAAPACSVGAPQIRLRTYFGAYDSRLDSSALGAAVDRMGNAENLRVFIDPDDGAVGGAQREVQSEARQGDGEAFGVGGSDVGMGNANGTRAEAGVSESPQRQEGDAKIHDDRGGGLLRSSSRGPGIDRMAYSTGERWVGWGSGEESDQPREIERPDGLCDVGRMGNANGTDGERDTGELSAQEARVGGAWQQNGDIDQRLEHASSGVSGGSGGPSPLNGFWSDADWLFCRDGKWRPAKPSPLKVADGSSGRVGRLRAYGNGIVPPQATCFIESFQEAINHALNCTNMVTDMEVDQ